MQRSPAAVRGPPFNKQADLPSPSGNCVIDELDLMPANELLEGVVVLHLAGGGLV
jgi:hypothetical protein